MKTIPVTLFALLLLFSVAASALEPTSPGIRANRKDGVSSASNPSTAGPFTQSGPILTITFWHQSPRSSFGLVDAITSTVDWKRLQNYEVSGPSDSVFPCRFTFRCSIDERVIPYCNVMSDNRASYRMYIDLNGLVHVSVDGPGRQSVSFDAEGARKRIHVFGRTDGSEARCGIEP